MSVPFTRQLGARSGIQLNQVIDATGDRFNGGNGNQNFATVARLDRGRIDKAFRVNIATLTRLCGQPASPIASRLNEAYVHLYEGLRNGGNEAVVYRLNVTGASNLPMHCIAESDTEAGVWSAAGSAPGGSILSVTHHECFNEGVRPEINAIFEETIAQTASTNIALTGTAPLEINTVAVTHGQYVRLTAQTDATQDGIYVCAVAAGNYTLTPATSKVVTLRLKDVNSGAILFSFTGSLDPAAKDEFGASYYLPNVVSAATEDVSVTVATSAQVTGTSLFFGTDANGDAKWIGEDLVYFTESSTTYDNEDYDRACTALKYTEYQFGYIEAGGTQAATLLSKLIALGKDINKQVIWDIDGSKTPAQAITFYNTVNVDTHYSQCYWAPLKTDDPLNGGKDYIGLGGLQVGLRCARNANTDANGIPPKNWVIAGKQMGTINRTGVVQTYTPTEQELDDLAKAKINPVIFQRYNTGGAYVFFDSLTGAKTEGDRKLIAVAEMSSQNDEWVTQYAQECLQLPMEEAIKRMTAFLQALFEGEEAARWIKPSAELGGRSFVAQVQANAARPSDRMDVKYWLHYDGTVRAIYVEQTISK